MCEIVLNHWDRVVVAPFDAIVQDVNSVLRSVNKRFGVDLPMLPMSDVEANTLIDDKVRSRHRHGEAAPARIGVPDAARDRAKVEAMSQLLTLPELAVCQALYARIMDRQIAGSP
jgi:hypothetical protein